MEFFVENYVSDVYLQWQNKSRGLHLFIIPLNM